MPEGSNETDVDVSLLMRALPGGHGILLLPAGTFQNMPDSEFVDKMSDLFWSPDAEL